MEKTFPTWAWIALGFYFAVCSIGGSYQGPFIALGCGYLAAKSRYKKAQSDQSTEPLA